MFSLNQISLNTFNSLKLGGIYGNSKAQTVSRNVKQRRPLWCVYDVLPMVERFREQTLLSGINRQLGIINIERRIMKMKQW